MDLQTRRDSRNIGEHALAHVLRTWLGFRQVPQAQTVKLGVRRIKNSQGKSRNNVTATQTSGPASQQHNRWIWQ